MKTARGRQYKIITWHGEGKSLFYIAARRGKYGWRIVNTEFSLDAAKAWIAIRGQLVEIAGGARNG